MSIRRCILGWAVGIAPAWLFSSLLGKDPLLFSFRQAIENGTASSIMMCAAYFVSPFFLVLFHGIFGFLPVAVIVFATLAQYLSKRISKGTTFLAGLPLGVVWGVLAALPMCLSPFVLGEYLGVSTEGPVLQSFVETLVLVAGNAVMYFVPTFIAVGIVGNLLSALFFRESKKEAGRQQLEQQQPVYGSAPPVSSEPTEAVPASRLT